MKLKLLFLVFIFNFLSIVSFAQEKNIEIQVSLKSPAIETKSKNVPVKIKITNKSEQILDTEDLGNLVLYFSTCRQDDEMCYRLGGLLSASVEIKSTKIKKNKSIEFEANLSDLVWGSILSSFRSSEKNFYTISKENKYFYAALPTRKNVLPDGTRLADDFLSNQITVRLK